MIIEIDTESECHLTECERGVAIDVKQSSVVQWAWTYRVHCSFKGHVYSCNLLYKRYNKKGPSPTSP